MRRMVTAGLLGRKSGKGFYAYSGGKRELLNAGKFAHVEGRAFPQAVCCCSASSYATCSSPFACWSPGLHGGISTRPSAWGSTFQGLRMADSLGLDAVVEMGTGFYEETGSDKFFSLPAAAHGGCRPAGAQERQGFYEYEA